MTVAVKDVQTIKALAELTVDQQAQLSAMMYRRDYLPGEFIFFEGEIAHGIWFILQGKVRIIKHSEGGRIQGLCITSSGKCFGGCPLFDGDVNPASAQALDHVTLLILDDKSRDDLERRDPQFLWTLLQIFSQRLDLLARLGEGLGAWKVSTRINDCLATHCNEQMVVSLTHEKLAEMSGTVREVVTRHLHELEENGVIQTEAGQITILEIDQLKAGCLAQM